MPSLAAGVSPSGSINDGLWCVQESLLFPRPTLHITMTFEIRALDKIGKTVFVVIYKAFLNYVFKAWKSS